MFSCSSRKDIQYNLNSSSTDGSFTVDDSNSFFFQSLQSSSNSSRKQILRVFLLLSWHCMLCVLIRIASSRRFLWVHSTFNRCVENRKDFPNLSLLLLELVPWLLFSGSKYPWLEQISMVPKMFEPLRFDCSLLVIIYFHRFLLAF